MQGVGAPKDELERSHVASSGIFFFFLFLQFDVCFVYFTRLDRGPISEPTSIEMSEAKMSAVSL